MCVFFIDQRERHLCERETLIICLPFRPQLVIKPAIYICALTGNQTHILVYRDDAPTNLVTRSGHKNNIFLIEHFEMTGIHKEKNLNYPQSYYLNISIVDILMYVIYVYPSGLFPCIYNTCTFANIHIAMSWMLVVPNPFIR